MRRTRAPFDVVWSFPDWALRPLALFAWWKCLVSNSAAGSVASFSDFCLEHFLFLGIRPASNAGGRWGPAPLSPRRGSDLASTDAAMARGWKLRSVAFRRWFGSLPRFQGTKREGRKLRVQSIRRSRLRSGGKTIRHVNLTKTFLLAV